MKKRVILSLVLAALFTAHPRDSQASFQDDFPNLPKYLFVQPEPKLFFGGGLTPISVMNQKPDMALSIFQAHWISGLLDFEIFNGMIGFSYLSSSTSFSLNHFTFRTAPKFRITQNISLGALIGIEFVSFSSVTAKTTKGGFITPTQSFSTDGLIYGFILSETFTIAKIYKLKINQTAYKQTYSTTNTFNGWQYQYDNAALNSDQGPIAPGLVFQLEFSFLY